MRPAPFAVFLTPALILLGVYWVSTLAVQSPGASLSIDRAAPEQLAQGKAIYDQVCAACHGINGEGQPNWRQPDAQGVYPAPPHNSEGHTWHHPDDVLLDIIAQGGTMPTSAMPGFAGQLTQNEMQLVLDYIKTFWGATEAAFQRDVSRSRGR